MRARGARSSSVRVKAWISNAAEFNARMLWEGLYVRRKEAPLVQRLPLSDLKEEEVGALQSGCKQPLITVPWLCSRSFPCNAHTWSTSAIFSPTSGYVNFCLRCESAVPSQWRITLTAISTWQSKGYYFHTVHRLTQNRYHSTSSIRAEISGSSLVAVVR